MQRTCTCALRRVLAVTSEQFLQSISKSSTPITSTSAALLSTRRTITGRRSLMTSQAYAYPRQATPFSPASQRLNDTLSATDYEAVEQDSSSQAGAPISTNKSKATPSSSSSSAWYLSETPSPSTSSSSSSTSKSIPNPPHTLPSYLLPLWNHIYESPFLDQQTINFIDSKTVQENVSIENMDASVSNWVDWVVVASLRNGRERGIRGASEGVKHAMQECLKVFDEQLAATELASVSLSSNASDLPTPTKSKRKKKIPKVLIEGLEIKEPQWALIDGSKAIIHIMTSKARKTWQVEGVASDFSEVNGDVERIGAGEKEGEEDAEVMSTSNEYPSSSNQTGMGSKAGVSQETAEFQPRM